MSMLIGTGTIALIIILIAHVIIWQVRAISWLPNYVGTCLAVGALGGVAVGMFFTGTVHLIFTGIILICVGIPSFLIMNKYPRKRPMPRW